MATWTRNVRDDNDKSNDDTQNDGDRVGKLPDRRPRALSR